MPRPSQLTDKRRELLPLLARAFTRAGYRRATTALLAEECGVQENILYRIWPDKKAMFLAAIDYVYEFSERTWLRLLDTSDGQSDGALRLLLFEAQHHGEFGHYRILFSGLAEADDPEIREALRRVFSRFHRFLAAQIVAHRTGSSRQSALDAGLAAWAFVGIGTIMNIGRELDTITTAERQRLITELGAALLQGTRT
ncbi:MAG: TetR/AcrR family transcriptional regulator [Planctomycetia bacterium]|nr:MAG: TetR/AcrR family transcriptional regulator [Planctomycetia bacterium]